GRAIGAKGPITQLLAVYLFSNRHCPYLCIYNLPVMYMCADLHLSESDVKQALANLEELDFARYDYATETIFIVNGPRYQVADSLKPNDNKVKAMRREFKVVSDASPLKQEFYDMYNVDFHLG